MLKSHLLKLIKFQQKNNFLVEMKNQKGKAKMKILKSEID